MIPCVDATMPVPSGGIGNAVLSIAASRSLQALGDACQTGIQHLVGSGAVGLYFLDQHRPHLFYSKQAPEGFIREYGETSYRYDPLLAYVQDMGLPIDGSSLLGAANWLQSGNFDLLRRWGFMHCMAGPLYVDDRLVGVVYTASGVKSEAYVTTALDSMGLLCRAGSLALTHMVETGRLNGRPSAWAEKGDAVGFGRSTRDLADNETIRQLPERSREVAMLLCYGQSNKEIARTLGISAYTVKDHVSRLCRKLEAHNRTELVQRMLTEH